MSEIKHQWNGSVLTVISDSGASSADLKGPKGDTGPRGPQGPGGVIYNEDGELVLDLSEYYSKSEVDDLLDNVEVDLSDYATKTYVTETITNESGDSGSIASKTYVRTEVAKAQLEGAGIDASVFATTQDINRVIGELTNTLGMTKTGINVIDYYNNNTLQYKMWKDTEDEEVVILTMERPLINGQTYNYAISTSDGWYGEGTVKMQMGILNLKYQINGETVYEYLWSVNRNIMREGEGDNQFYFSSGRSDNQLKRYYITNLRIWTGEEEYEPIKPELIPIDGTTIFINNEGYLQASAHVLYSTVDLEAGVSPLASGVLYCVYEE